MIHMSGQISPRAGIGNVEEGHYRYLHDHLELEATATGLGPSCFRPATPLRLQAWQKALANHPDQLFAQYILNGIANSFHIGADRTIRLRSNSTNMPSVRQHPQLVEAHIRAESTAGRLLGPLGTCPGCSRLAQLVLYQSLTSRENGG